VDYLGIPAVAIGLRHLAGIGIETVHERVIALAGWLLSELGAMRHRSGTPLVRIYGPTTMERRGGAVTVNFQDSRGAAIDHRTIESEANGHGISLRTGCFCNPGAGEVALGITRGELATCFTGPGHDKRLTIDDFRQCIDGKSTGAVRVSVGLVSDFKDIEAFLAFARGFLDR
jgi:selenocysteine lyase/cysteine desulfurase